MLSAGGQATLDDGLESPHLLGNLLFFLNAIHAVCIIIHLQLIVNVSALWYDYNSD